MKNTLILSFAVLIGSLMFISCNETPPVQVKKAKHLTLLTEKDTLPPNVYREWKSRWARTGKAYTNNTLTEYFTLPLIDLNEFALEGNHVAARFELGMDSTAVGLVPHIMLVGVDSTGTSMIPPYAPGNIYDVSRPCPHSCGSKSINKTK